MCHPLRVAFGPIPRQRHVCRLLTPDEVEAPLGPTIVLANVFEVECIDGCSEGGRQDAGELGRAGIDSLAKAGVVKAGPESQSTPGAESRLR